MMCQTDTLPIPCLVHLNVSLSDLRFMGTNSSKAILPVAMNPMFEDWSVSCELASTHSKRPTIAWYAKLV